jgi:hypothetical protein
LPKLKLALTLPAAQLAIATILLWWPAGHVRSPDPTTAVLICWGLNAPALFFRVLGKWGPMFDLTGGAILGVGLGDFFFLLGVVVVWYLVGRTLDQRRTSEVAPKRHRPAAAILGYGFLLTLGGYLFFVGLHDFHDLNYISLRHPPALGLGSLAWSVSLILISGRGIVNAVGLLRLR